MRYYLVYNTILNLFWKDFDFSISINNNNDNNNSMESSSNSSKVNNELFNNLVEEIVNMVFLRNIARIGYYGEFREVYSRYHKDIKFEDHHRETLKKIKTMVFNGDIEELRRCVIYCITTSRLLF